MTLTALTKGAARNDRDLLLVQQSLAEFVTRQAGRLDRREHIERALRRKALEAHASQLAEQVAAAHAMGLPAVLSSSIESSLGLTQLARIAAWLTPETIPGLDTLDLMQAQQARRWPGSPLPLVDVDALERLL